MTDENLFDILAALCFSISSFRRETGEISNSSKIINMEVLVKSLEIGYEKTLSNVRNIYL